MGSKTEISWTDSTWSPLRARVKADAGEIARAKGYASLIEIAGKMVGHVGPHCEHVSPGCENCYSGTNNHRCLPVNGTGLPFDRRSRDLIDSIVDEKALLLPLKWGEIRGEGIRPRPRRIFVENQSDLFGDWVTDEQIDRVFAVMMLCPQHEFQVLTKRERMRKYFGKGFRRFDEVRKCAANMRKPSSLEWGTDWPLRNVWLGVSVEDQATAEWRIPWLLQTPAAKRFVSAEPLLSAIDWLLGSHSLIDWIIVGGESGHGARPFDIQWARNMIRQCKEAGVACFVKQLGANSTIPLNDRKGGDWLEWPLDLRVREFPQ